MSVLERSVFIRRGENVESGDLSRAEVSNFSTDIDQALRTYYGWRNKPSASLAYASHQTT
jgi:hypothetical protein